MQWRPQFQILFAASACPIILSNLLRAIQNRLQRSRIQHKLAEQINYLLDDLRGVASQYRV